MTGPLSYLPPPATMARIAKFLIDQPDIGSISPAAANDLTVRSFAIERVIPLAPEDLRPSLWAFVGALRIAGEMQFALSGVAIMKFRQLLEAERAP